MEVVCSRWFNIKETNSISVKAIIDDYLDIIETLGDVNEESIKS